MTDAKEYARALFLITEEDGVTDNVVADAAILKGALLANPDYVKLLDTPALTKAQRLEMLSATLAGLDWRLSNLVKILTEGHKAHLVVKMINAYADMVDEARGILRVEAVTAIPLSDAQSKALSGKLSAKTGKTVIIKNTVEPSILGGVKLRYAGVQLDGTVQTRLSEFEKGLRTLVL